MKVIKKLTQFFPALNPYLRMSLENESRSVLSDSLRPHGLYSP